MPQPSASTLKLFQECPRCFWLRINQMDVYTLLLERNGHRTSRTADVV